MKVKRVLAALGVLVAIGMLSGCFCFSRVHHHGGHHHGGHHGGHGHCD